MIALSYIKKVFVAIDQLLNTILGPLLNLVLNPRTHKFGNEDETISSVLGKNVRDGSCFFCYYICRILHVFDRNHCKKTIEEDEGQLKEG